MAPSDATVGAVEIGVLFSTFLFGLATVQAHSYFRSYSRDTWILKTFVAIIWTLELLHTVLTFHAIYTVTVSNYGQSATVNAVPATFSIAIIVTAVIVPMIQAFFANRIRIMSSSWSITLSCFVLLFVRFIALIGVSAASLRTRDITDIHVKWRWLLISAITISAASDVMITGSMCFFLVKRRQNTPFTVQLFDRLTAWTLQTGLLTCCATISTLIFFLAMNNLAWITMVLINSKLFTNSFLASLNARNTYINTPKDRTQPTFPGIRHSISVRVQARALGLGVEMTKTRISITPNATLGGPSDSDLELVDPHISTDDRRA